MHACAARELLKPSSLELGGVGIHGSKYRRIFLDLNQILTALEHGVYVRARRTSTESSTAKWEMTNEVRLTTHSSMHSKVDGLSASQS